ncbi:MAG: outer membrane protein assembly factor BamD, partial [Deltaproteobacteria bacterium]|nr:outer membrane protein assembly factor BamD [Deltaproteobacteria bacterium]
CLKSLSEHEFGVGKDYYKQKRYKAALGRFMIVLTQYPDVGVHYDALQYIAICEAVIKTQEEIPALNPDSSSEK